MFKIFNSTHPDMKLDSAEVSEEEDSLGTKAGIGGKQR